LSTKKKFNMKTIEQNLEIKKPYPGEWKRP
jgi:hypothetical protein